MDKVLVTRSIISCMRSWKGAFTTLLVIFAFLSVHLFNSPFIFAHTSEPIHYFYSDVCPHCKNVEAAFNREGWFEEFSIEKHETYFDKENALIYQEMMNARNIPLEEWGVPAVIIGDTVIIGDKPIIEQFYDVASAYQENEHNHENEETGEKANLTIFVVIGASLVDAINPCAFAVLIMLITAVLAAGGGRKALFAGLMFSLSIFISYLLMGLGLYKALSLGNFPQIFIYIIGIFAVILGLLNVKDYFWYGKGVLMEVPLSWRPHLKKLLMSVTSPRGAFFVGFVVSLFLLPCSSGPYIVILGMLSQKSTEATAFLYLVLYNLVFVSPMILITLAVYKGFDPGKFEKSRQKNLKLLHLIAGLILIGMGLAIIFGVFGR